MPWFAGATRQEVDWGPTIDPKKCVFEWADGKSVVARRDDCVVGCMTCGNLCQGHAISFPPLDDLRTFYRDHHVWKQVKEAMIAAGKIPAGS
jgi:hypothetical protein